MENRPKKKDAAYYVAQRGKFEEPFKGNEFLTLPEALEAMKTCIVFLLNTKTRKLTGASRENLEEPLKTVNISPKVLAKRTNAVEYYPTYGAASKRVGQKCLGY